MVRLEQSALIYAVADALRQRGGWAGETHIQKATYVLQHLLKVPVGVKYILYKHGPFSFDLRSIIAEMEAEQFILWEPKPLPYGPSLTPGPESTSLIAVGGQIGNFARQIEFVADRLARKRVAQVERLATALYVSIDRSVALNDRANRIRELKPHISLQEATESVSEIDDLQSDAERNGLILGRQLASAC